MADLSAGQTRGSISVVFADKGDATACPCCARGRGGTMGDATQGRVARHVEGGREGEKDRGGKAVRARSGGSGSGSSSGSSESRNRGGSGSGSGSGDGSRKASKMEMGDRRVVSGGASGICGRAGSG